MILLPQEVGLVHSIQQLLPATNEPEAWRRCAEQVQNLLIEQRNLGHRWEFDVQELEIINKYLASTLRLVECLELASIADREAVLNRLFTVPEQTS